MKNKYFGILIVTSWKEGWETLEDKGIEKVSAMTHNEVKYIFLKVSYLKWAGIQRDKGVK